MKVATIVGTRPQYVKVDTKLPGQIIINTGQHYDPSMKDIFMKEFGIKKFDYECSAVDLMTMIKRLREALKAERPTCALLYGDCRSTLAGAIAASDLSIPIVHVEAGMRAYNRSMPEERIRVAVDHMSHILLAPDQHSAENLEREGIEEGVFIVGNTMFDTFNDTCPLKPTKDKGTYSYLSIHREENKRSKVRLLNILEAIQNSGMKFVWPIHPATAKALEEMKIRIPHNVKLMEPVGYKHNIKLIANARRVLTDSGGVQNEAYWLGVPCGLLRKETEWVGFVEDGWSKLLDSDPLDIQSFLETRFNPGLARPHMPKFGAKQRIRQILKEIYG